MKKADAEAKAKALGKDLVGKVAEHNGTKRQCKIESVDASLKTGSTSDFEVFCSVTPLHSDITKKKLVEEIDFFLRSYKILDLNNPGISGHSPPK